MSRPTRLIGGRRGTMHPAAVPSPGALLLGALLVASCASPEREAAAGRPAAQDIPTPAGTGGWSMATGSFAYANADGGTLLALDSLFPASAVSWAVCAGGTVLSVRHVGWQDAKPGDTGRQLAANFDRQAGDRFAVQGGRAAPDASCYLTGSRALAMGVLSPAPTLPAQCAPALKARLEAAEKRTVAECRPLAAFATGETVTAARFETVGTSALAVLAVTDGDHLRLDRYPVTVQEPDQDLWQVDDQGAFRSDLIRIPFAARLPVGVLVAVQWQGAEGETLYLMAPGSDPRREGVEGESGEWGRWHRGGRYQVPE